MQTLRTLSRSFFSRTIALTILLGLFAAPGALFAQNQTNDPLVDEQQYLFDVHDMDEAWSFRTGSPDVHIGVYSFLGFDQNHEDYSGPRIETPRGPLRPKYDYATEVAGIAAASTNNGLGVAGVDRSAELQSYSMLRTESSGNDSEVEATVDGETFFLDLRRFADVIEEGRSNGVDVHLVPVGLPSGLSADYVDPIEIDHPPFVPDPDSLAPDLGPSIDSTQSIEREVVSTFLKSLYRNVLSDICLSGCSSPPPASVEFRQAVGNATRLDGGVVVTPTGDVDAEATESNIPISPATLGRYTVTVAGLQKDSKTDEIVQWERSNATEHVDVAGFADRLAAPSSVGFSAYNTKFTSTVGAAAIGTGVASLLRGENPNFNSEDVEQILKRTAKDVGQPGFDEETGAGRIDAGAALAFVNNNDVQRSTQSVETVLSTQTIDDDVDLSQGGYLSQSPAGCNAVAAEGELKKFQAKVPYTQTFSAAPDAWIRWSESDGYQTSRLEIGDEVIPTFDQFQKGLEIVEVKGRHIVVEGYYFVADFFNTLGQRCAKNIRLPDSPSDFNIAYTAVGTEGPPPPLASISGPTFLAHGDTGTWTASVDGGSGPTSYAWEAKDPGSFTWSGTGCSGDTCSRAFFNDSDQVQMGGIRTIVTKGAQSDTAAITVTVTPSCGDNVLICPATADADVAAVALRDLHAENTGEKGAVVTWGVTGSLPASEFVLQHRRDSTATWSTLGTVAAGDSVRADTSDGPAYQFDATDLDVGTHQFRLAYDVPVEVGGDPVRVVGNEAPAARTWTSETVTARIELEDAFELSIYPNPVRQQATLELAVRKPQEVQVQVYDVLGRRVETVHDGRLSAQRTERIQWTAAQSSLSSGSYFLRVTGETFEDTRQVIVVR